MNKYYLLIVVLSILITTIGGAAVVRAYSPNPNNLPVAQDMSVTTSEDTPVPVTLVATDADGDTLSYGLVTWPSHGTLSGTRPNLTFIPDANYFGTVSFTYKAKDHWGSSNVATVSINITPVNDPPVAANDNYSTKQGITLKVSTPGVLKNDKDIDGGPLTAIRVDRPEHGWLTLNPNGSFTYQPKYYFDGVDQFHYQAFDGNDYSDVRSVGITVKRAGHVLVAEYLTVITPKNIPVAVDLVAVSINGGEYGDVLGYDVNTVPAQGTLSGTVPHLTFTPKPNYIGTDSLTYTAKDQWGISNIAIVDIIVTP